jgi:hypothetical protein
VPITDRRLRQTHRLGGPGVVAFRLGRPELERFINTLRRGSGHGEFQVVLENRNNGRWRDTKIVQ